MSFVAGAGMSNCDLLYLGMPRIPREGEEIYSKDLSIQMGGGVPATLLTLSRLGISVKLSTFLGEDAFSKVVKMELLQNGVDFTNLYFGKGVPVTVTSTMITIEDRTFVSYRNEVPITDRICERIYQQCRGAKLVEMHSGFLEVYKKLKNESVTMLLDTGWEDDLSIEKYADYIELADYYTPSRKEAQKITGTSTPEDAIKILGKYFKTPIVKLDKQGCMVMENGKISIVPSIPDFKVVDSTGAGDAFLAGLMYGLFYDYDIRTSILFGNITGGACVAGIGCVSNYVKESELLSIAKRYREIITRSL
jgi:sugar/nucleoside kinase (ribokinase family)